MTDTQILTIFLAALPTSILVAIGILTNNARLTDTNRRLDEMRLDTNRQFADTNRRIDEMRSEMTRRFDESRELWRAELHRVEEVLDARLKHIEESR